jgi:hypothetical protein
MVRLLVPTLCVGNALGDALRRGDGGSDHHDHGTRSESYVPLRQSTQSVRTRIPTQSVGTRLDQALANTLSAACSPLWMQSGRPTP